MGELLHFTDCDGADPCSCDRAGLPLTTGEGNTAREQTIGQGRFAEFQRAEAAEAECGRLREQLDAARQALRGVSNAYGCFAGCTGALAGAPADDSGHTPACRAARAALGVEGPAE